MSGDLGPVARGILDAGRDGDDPTPGDRARVRASLMKAVAIGSGAAVGLAAAGKASASVAPKAAAGAAAVAKTASTFGVAKVVGVLTIAIAVGGGGYAISERAPSRNDAARASAPIAVTPPIEPAKAAPNAVAAPAEVAVPNEVPKSNEASNQAPFANEAASEASNEAPKAAPRVASAPSAVAIDPLALETKQLRDANQAIRAGNANRALAILDARNDGVMSEERIATRVLALCNLGRVEEANAAASRFVSEHPRSIFVDRMRRPCDGDRGAR